MARFIVTIVAFWITNAWAILPDNGWYWNPAESGRGLNIEIQNNILFAAGFVYDNVGDPIWVTTGGPMSSDHTYSGAVILTSGGQCIGCMYRAPTVSNIGNITITFPTSLTAVVNVDGTILNLQREQFGLDFSNTATPLLGEWATTEGSEDFPVYFGERLDLVTTVNSSSGLGAGGWRAGDTSHLVAGIYVPAAGAWGLLLDSSTSFYKQYTFTFNGFNQIVGVESTYPKGGSPVGSSDMVGQRIESAALVGTGSGPGIAKRAVDREAIDTETYQRQKAEGKALDPRIVEVARALLKIAPR